ncbi:MAG: SDR family NAD(P)-dependent oxidoreductase, partial [Parasynechococcus sp.]
MGWTVADIPSQEGRIAVVTGANIGLGLETTRALAQKGATVVMACRSRSRGEAARRQLLDEGLTGLDLLEIDLADLRSVDRAVDVLKNQYGHLDLLLNNAGVMAPPRQLSPQGHELQFAVNHLGHMALTQGLLPLMAAQPDARIVTVTSGAQYFGTIRWDDLSWAQGYDRYGAYGQSKLANVMFALE